MVVLYLFACQVLSANILWLPLLAAPFVALGLILRRLQVAAGALAAFYALAFLCYLPPFEAYKPVPAFAEKIRVESERLGNQVEAGYFNLAVPSLVFYLGRPVFEAYSLEEASGRLKSDKVVYLIVRAEDYAALRAATGLPLEIVDSKPKLYTNARFFLGGLRRDGYKIDRRIGAVYLVTNRSPRHSPVIDHHPGLQRTGESAPAPRQTVTDARPARPQL